MKYMGSKDRHAKELLAIMLKDRKPDQYWIEPFVGGANVIDKVEGLRIGSDINWYLIACLQRMSEYTEWIPEDVTEEEYRNVRDNKSRYLPEIVGYCGFALSYGGKFFGGYAKHPNSKRNDVMEAYRNAIKQAPKLKGIDFRCGSYENLEIPDNSIVYCDPPYAGKTKYKDNFNHSYFWYWAKKTSENNRVYVSEYDAPSDWKCIWEKEVSSSLKEDESKKSVEKLFILH